MEAPVAEYIARAFQPYADDIRTDSMNNVVARMGSTGPRIMVAAHMDEIGLIVTKIEDDGCLRIARNGGVDPRILPGMEVSVVGKNGRLFGVVGAKAPHVLTDQEKKKALTLPELYVDIGYSAEDAKKLVRIGDAVLLLGETEMLAGQTCAGKTMDDRACVAMMLVAAEHLAGMRVNAQVFFVASTQEEIGSHGAKTAAYALDPDMAIAADVAHGEGPGSAKFEAFPLDKVVMGTGPALHPALLSRLKKVAADNGIQYEIEVTDGPTWTDADAIYTARFGVPTALLSVPVKYMHTTVETLSLNTIREAGRLLALFIQDVTREWEEIKWY